MTATAIRKVLINYLEDADDKKVKAIYTLLEKEIEDSTFILSEEQLSFLDKERELYLAGQTIPYTRLEALEAIRNTKK